ncbi:MAG TPA: hypothetical protein H9742_11360 [Candidatus Acetatifactor stercoripullorum]|uniref:Uncharacterized protein n=1 Tax=Candidatus Acetatifactor stercoripullorum TaxID=2838414 RepID=A0A9D1R6W9_9FIRM|nr:hypothetical protein [uncultured Acetatifactor sp.]HIW82090.1 hypothetical protein [Candidatus Acetatifactor stercoripullorum]
MKKKAVNAAFCLAVSLMLALAGCGSTAEEGTGEQTQVLDEREVEVQEEKEVVATGKITMEPGETGEAEQTPETEETKEAAGTEETEETEQAAAETAEETKQAAASQSTKTAQTKESTKASGSGTGSTAASKPAESQAASSSTGSTAASKPAESQAASGSGTGSTAASKPAESQAASGSGTGSTAASKPAEAHTHSFTSVKISDATCESGAVYEERCSCGATNGTHTEGSGLGHDYQYSGPYVAATCSGGGIDEDKCTRCGAIRWTNVPALPHSWTETLTFAGNCNTKSEYTITCSVCGAPGGTREGDYTDDHDWQTFSWQDVDLATGEYITITEVGCSRCGKKQ